MHGLFHDTETGLGPFAPDCIYHGDAIGLMKDLPDGAIDLIVTDPPFAIDFRAQRLNYNRTGSNVIEGYQRNLMPRTIFHLPENG